MNFEDCYRYNMVVSFRKKGSIMQGGSVVTAEPLTGGGLIHTNDRCTGCNRCIKACSIPGANISVVEPGMDHARIRVNGGWCIACGACLDVCEHDARTYDDDTERFFKDLESGVPISLLIAPAFKANYPEEYGAILGGLKNTGGGYSPHHLRELRGGHRAVGLS